MSFKRGPRTIDEAVAAARELAELESGLDGAQAATAAAIEVAAETVARPDAGTAFGRAVLARRRATEAADEYDRAWGIGRRAGLRHLGPKGGA